MSAEGPGLRGGLACLPRLPAPTSRRLPPGERPRALVASGRASLSGPLPPSLRGSAPWQRRGGAGGSGSGLPARVGDPSALPAPARSPARPPSPGGRSRRGCLRRDRPSPALPAALPASRCSVLGAPAEGALPPRLSASLSEPHTRGPGGAPWAGSGGALGAPGSAPGPPSGPEGAVRGLSGQPPPRGGRVGSADGMPPSPLLGRWAQSGPRSGKGATAKEEPRAPRTELEPGARRAPEAPHRGLASRNARQQ